MSSGRVEIEKTHTHTDGIITGNWGMEKQAHICSSTACCVTCCCTATGTQLRTLCSYYLKCIYKICILNSSNSYWFPELLRERLSSHYLERYKTFIIQRRSYFLKNQIRIKYKLNKSMCFLLFSVNLLQAQTANRLSGSTYCGLCKQIKFLKSGKQKFSQHQRMCTLTQAVGCTSQQHLDCHSICLYCGTWDT